MNDKMTNCFSKEVRNHSVITNQNQQHKKKNKKTRGPEGPEALTWSP